MRWITASALGENTGFFHGENRKSQRNYHLVRTGSMIIWIAIISLVSIFLPQVEIFFFFQSLFHSVETRFADTCMFAGFIDKNIFVFIEMKGKMIFFQSFFFYSFRASDEFLSSPYTFDYLINLIT